MNEISHTEMQRVDKLLAALKPRLSASQYQRVAAFVAMERIDPYFTLKDLGEHLKMQFPELFQEILVTAESVIKLRDLVAEITLNNIEPYTNNIQWEADGPGYEFQFPDDAGNQISVYMADNSTDEYSVYEVSFFVKSAPDAVFSANKTVSGTTANYLRIMSTVGAAIMDFLQREQPAMLEFTGADSDPKKAAQKTRLYSQFARDNAAKFRALGYRFVSNHMGTGLERID